MWKDLSAAGFVSGHAYGKALRTVKTCVGKEWCRFGTQDSTGLGIKLERTTWGSWHPHKVKLAVSGCPRNCAEATIKDLGVVCVESGYELHVGGNGGIKVRATDFLCKVATEEEVLEYCCAFLQLYREEARYLERTAPWIERVGLTHVRTRIVDDAAGRRALYERFRRIADALAGGSRGPSARTARTRTSSRRCARRRDGNRRRERRHELGRRGSRERPARARRAHAEDRQPRDRSVPHGHGRSVRAARPLPASRRAAVAGHRARRPRDLPAARLGHRSEIRLRDRRRRRQHADVRGANRRRPRRDRPAGERRGARRGARAVRRSRPASVPDGANAGDGRPHDVPVLRRRLRPRRCAAGAGHASRDPRRPAASGESRAHVLEGRRTRRHARSRRPAAARRGPRPAHEPERGARRRRARLRRRRREARTRRRRVLRVRAAA